MYTLNFWNNFLILNIFIDYKAAFLLQIVFQPIEYRWFRKQIAYVNIIFSFSFTRMIFRNWENWLRKYTLNIWHSWSPWRSPGYHLVSESHSLRTTVLNLKYSLQRYISKWKISLICCCLTNENSFTSKYLSVKRLEIYSLNCTWIL